MNHQMVLLPDGSWIDASTVQCLIPSDGTPESKDNPAKPPKVIIISTIRGDLDYKCETLEEAKQVASEIARAINSAP